MSKEEVKIAFDAVQKASLLLQQLQKEKDMLCKSALNARETEASAARNARILHDLTREIATATDTLYDMRQRVQEAIDDAHLSPLQELVIRKRFISGLSVIDAAGEIYLSERQVVYLTAQALAKLGAVM